MPVIDVVVDCPVHESFHVRQIAGMFDLPLDKLEAGRTGKAQARFIAEVPDLSEPWDIGLIVGPSGSGKTTVARKAFGEYFYRARRWSADRAVIDCLGDLPIKQIVAALSAVGFCSPPAWIKPYAVLSNGEKFRCDLARALLCDRPLVVFDEFTSVVDRTVARMGSAAVAKTIRRGKMNRRFVAVSCHYDIAQWLQPDWVLDMITGKLARGRLRRPRICLEIIRVNPSAWRIFRRHHYLSGRLHPSAQCFVGLVESQPAVFAAVLQFPHPTRPGWREHRLVCLPDFQGIRIGNTMSEFVASLFAATGKPYRSCTSHPAMIHHRARSPLWRIIRRPGLTRPGRNGRTIRHEGSDGGEKLLGHSGNRLSASFQYIGPERRREAEGFGVIKN